LRAPALRGEGDVDRPRLRLGAALRGRRLDDALLASRLRLAQGRDVRDVPGHARLAHRRARRLPRRGRAPAPAPPRDAAPPRGPLSATKSAPRPPRPASEAGDPPVGRTPCTPSPGLLEEEP